MLSDDSSVTRNPALSMRGEETNLSFWYIKNQLDNVIVTKNVRANLRFQNTHSFVMQAMLPHDFPVFFNVKQIRQYLSWFLKGWRVGGIELISNTQHGRSNKSIIIIHLKSIEQCYF